jgi:hypothetical protein
MRHIQRSILLLICLTFFCVQAAFSCGCIPKTFEEKFAETDFIFVGKVIEVKADKTIKRQPDEVRKYFVKMQIIKNFKGAKTNRINLVQYEITYGFPCSAWNLEVGETYLIYAGGSGKEIMHYVACAPTQKFDPNSPDYEDLLQHKAKKRKKIS